MQCVLSAGLESATLLSGSKLTRLSIPRPVRLAVSQWVDAKDFERVEMCMRTIRGSEQVLLRIEDLIPRTLGDGLRRLRPTMERLCDLAGFEMYENEDFFKVLHDIEDTLRREYKTRELHIAQARVEQMVSFGDNLLAEMWGWREIIQSPQSTLLDNRENLIEGTVEALYGLDGSKFLIALCRTGKVEVLPVGKGCKTCEEAQLWLAGDVDIQQAVVSLPRFFSRGRT